MRNAGREPAGVENNRMTRAEFNATLGKTEPSDLSSAMRALWHDARGAGDWHRAHDLLQDDHTTEGSWVHAYLHRREGDLANAGYWYRRAGKTTPSGNLEAEWDSIVEALLTGRG
jgi:hypothetical protein